MSKGCGARSSWCQLRHIGWCPWQDINLEQATALVRNQKIHWIEPYTYKKETKTEATKDIAGCTLYDLKSVEK